MCPPHITDEIIDAILQNERRQMERPDASCPPRWAADRRPPLAPPEPQQPERFLKCNGDK
jgi:hypothetical protein